MLWEDGPTVGSSEQLVREMLIFDIVLLTDFTRPWVPGLIDGFLESRGGCVLFMDYYYYGNGSYEALWLHFEGIVAVLVKKIKQIDRYDKQYLFGFSFGARICIEAGLEIGNQSISRMDLCDPAGL